jgi:hypothetical protein
MQCRPLSLTLLSVFLVLLTGCLDASQAQDNKTQKTPAARLPVALDLLKNQTGRK